MGSEQHYSLRWNDYTVKIVTAFQSLRDEEDFVDVTVACDGHSYSAHKMVLSACSPYFRALLRANPCQHPIVILKDVGHVELERLLEFMYNGEVSIAQDQLAAFLRTAENLKIRGLAGSSDDMDQLGLQRPDVSYSYSSCSIGGAGGTSGRSSPSAGYAPSQGSKDEEVGGDGSGGYHARAESPPSKRRKRLSAPAAGHADLNTETHSSDNSEMSGRYRCQHILTSDLYYEGRVMVLGRAPLDPIKVSADTGPAKRTYGETSLDDECVVEATVEIESGGSLSGTLPGEDDVRQDRRELKSEPGDVMAEVYSETSELTDPTSHSGEGLDPRQSVLYPLALPGPSGAAGNQDSVGPHESGAGALVVAWATMVEEGSSGGGGGVGALGKSKPLSLGDAVDAASGECAMTAANSGGGGRLYPCPDCEKVFRHPRSYYQHQHVHRGTHSCPGCGKLFSRRWDLLRHLNKNKYGCPARWREGNRHPPYHNSLSLSALASAAAVAASSQEGLLPPSEAPDHQQPLHQPAVSWTVPSVTTGGVSGRQHSSRSSSSGSNGEPRPPEPPAASRTSP
ncbi:longitudinals lacking protein, isoforms H/M/V-like isoform X13 [Macrobrachium rosenbergii]|uniref:longitudinals lacking protein, isoforms H/M/V-like isoform X13 n=1 Tax=Macrobrachium rosenbergii TaxID=79674 RepID=UPI0034D7836E